MSVDQIDALHRRVIIRLDEYTLIITGVSKFTRQVEEWPTAWLSHVLTSDADDFSLCVELELGRVEVVGRDLRLIRNSDMAILIPAIDD